MFGAQSEPRLINCSKYSSYVAAQTQPFVTGGISEILMELNFPGLNDRKNVKVLNVSSPILN